jgi:hypothetical protein
VPNIAPSMCAGQRGLARCVTNRPYFDGTILLGGGKSLLFIDLL